jgi:hypothetical protein
VPRHRLARREAQATDEGRPALEESLVLHGPRIAQPGCRPQATKELPHPAAACRLARRRRS